MGEVGKAIEYYERSLKISREIGDKRGEGDVLKNLVIAHNRLGEIKKVAEYSEQELEILREIGEKSKEGQTLERLGLTYSFFGEKEKAIENYEQALTISRELGNKRQEEIIIEKLRNLQETKKTDGYYKQKTEVSKSRKKKNGFSLFCVGRK
ncbi:tetratricopeptide repeat protein [Methanosarcina horonobensis]|nr:tetratricopeptide repeat protein [Methanosarcina horonobensis]